MKLICSNLDNKSVQTFHGHSLLPMWEKRQLNFVSTYDILKNNHTRSVKCKMLAVLKCLVQLDPSLPRRRELHLAILVLLYSIVN